MDRHSSIAKRTRSRSDLRQTKLFKKWRCGKDEPFMYEQNVPEEKKSTSMERNCGKRKVGDCEVDFVAVAENEQRASILFNPTAKPVKGKRTLADKVDSFEVIEISGSDDESLDSDSNESSSDKRSRTKQEFLSDENVVIDLCEDQGEDTDPQTLMEDVSSEGFEEETGGSANVHNKEPDFDSIAPLDPNIPSCEIIDIFSDDDDDDDDSGQESGENGSERDSDFEILALSESEEADDSSDYDFEVATSDDMSESMDDSVSYVADTYGGITDGRRTQQREKTGQEEKSERNTHTSNRAFNSPKPSGEEVKVDLRTQSSESLQCFGIKSKKEERGHSSSMESGIKQTRNESLEMSAHNETEKTVKNVGENKSASHRCFSNPIRPTKPDGVCRMNAVGGGRNEYFQDGIKSKDEERADQSLFGSSSAESRIHGKCVGLSGKVSEVKRKIKGEKDNMDDVFSRLSNSIWEKGASKEETCEGESNPQVDEETLPLKFKFGVEEPELAEKSELEKELDNLWAEMEFAMKSAEIGSLNRPEVHNDGTNASGTESKPGIYCRLGKHQLILDVEIGIRCALCSFVGVEMRHVSPPFAEKYYSSKQIPPTEDNTPMLDKLQFQIHTNNSEEFSRKHIP